LTEIKRKGGKGLQARLKKVFASETGATRGKDRNSGTHPPGMSDTRGVFIPAERKNCQKGRASRPAATDYTPLIHSYSTVGGSGRRKVYAA